MSDNSGADADLSRRQFVGGSLGGLIAAHESFVRELESQPPEVQAFALDEVTIDELQARMHDGRETAQSLVAAYLERIDAIDQRGPTINAVIELNPAASSIAKTLDDERK